MNLYGVVGNDVVNEIDYLGWELGTDYDTAEEAIKAGGIYALKKGQEDLQQRQKNWDGETAAAEKTKSALDGPRILYPTQAYEFGGAVCCKTIDRKSKFSHTDAGDSKDPIAIRNYKLPTCPEGTNHAGIYHSHPNGGETNAKTSTNDHNTAKKGVPPDGKGGRVSLPDIP